MPVRLIKHEAVPKCGSYEIRYPDGRPSKYFYWDDVPGRRLRPETLTSDQAIQAARRWHERPAMKLADIEIPPVVARRFVEDMLAYYAEQPYQARRDANARFFHGKGRGIGLSIAAGSFSDAVGRSFRSFH
jgi:hypothetical protein